MQRRPRTPVTTAVVYSSSPSVRHALRLAHSQHASGEQLRLIYYPLHLDLKTVSLAAGSSASAVVVNVPPGDDCSAGVLRELARAGVRLLVVNGGTAEGVDVDAARSVGVRVVRSEKCAVGCVAMWCVGQGLGLVGRARGVEIGFAGMTVGVLGTGRVGRACVRVLAAFGCRVLACDVMPAEDVAAQYVDMGSLFEASDVLMLCETLTPASRGSVRKEMLQRCKRGVVLVCGGQSGVVEWEDVVEALRAGTIGGVGVDVSDTGDIGGEWEVDVDDDAGVGEWLGELRSRENCSVTERRGVRTADAMAKVAEDTVASLVEFCEAGSLGDTYVMSREVVGGGGGEGGERKVVVVDVDELIGEEDEDEAGGVDAEVNVAEVAAAMLAAVPKPPARLRRERRERVEIPEEGVESRKARSGASSSGGNVIDEGSEGSGLTTGVVADLG